MKARTRAWGLVAAILVIVGVLAWMMFASSNEPRYQGKSLGEWIQPFCRQTATNFNIPGGKQDFEKLQPIRRAVSAMGTNAVPSLIARLNYKESAIHRFCREWLKKHPLAGLSLTDPQVPRVQAARALAVLGPLARPAIPALSEQLSKPLVADHVAYALQSIGPDGMRELVNQYTNVPAGTRRRIVMFLVSPAGIYRGEGATPIDSQIPLDLKIEAACRVLEDTNMFLSGYRDMAIRSLGELGESASNAVPLLLKVVAGGNRNEMSRLMFLMGPSRTAFDALRKIKPRREILEGHRDLLVPVVKKVVASDIFDFSPNRDPDCFENQIPSDVFVEVMSLLLDAPAWGPGAWVGPRRTEAIERLGGVGPAASNAVPSLLRVLDKKDWSDYNSAAKALFNIDPETAISALTNRLKGTDGMAKALAIHSLVDEDIRRALQDRGISIPISASSPGAIFDAPSQRILPQRILREPQTAPDSRSVPPGITNAASPGLRRTPPFLAPGRPATP